VPSDASQHRGRALRWLPLALALLAHAQPVRALERGQVLLLQPASPGGLEREALCRLEGELRGAEFAVIRREWSTAADPGQLLERESRELVSAFAFALAAQGSVLRLWAYDGVTHRLSVQDWQGDDPHVASVLAVHGVELVRARLDAPESFREGDVPPTPTPAPAPAVPAESSLRFGFELGLAGAYEPAAGQGSLLPLGRVSLQGRAPFASSLGWGVRLGAGAFGPGATLHAAAGQARVVPSFLLADTLLSAFPGAALMPFVTLGLGLSRLRVEGSAEPGFFARETDALSPLWGAGLGLRARPFEHVALSFEAQSWFATDPTEVRIDAREVARFGQPFVLASATLVLLP
jgi:hypothetical protein